MPERPIIFSGPMVRAILAGAKTQTRRVVKPQPTGFMGGPGVFLPNGKPAPIMPMDDDVLPFGRAIPCPYGAPGDRLWVREAWRVGRKHDGTKPSDLSPRSMTVEYEAGGYACNSPWSAGEWHSSDCAPREHPEWVGKLRPPVHMPRWASRITLEVTGVRVERLREISDEDSLSEGLYPTSTGLYPGSPRAAYRKLSEQINGPGLWDANPWVWVVQFRRVDSAARQP